MSDQSRNILQRFSLISLLALFGAAIYTPAVRSSQASGPLHTLASAYFNVRGDLKSSLMINNKGAEVVQVEPVFFNLAGDKFVSKPIAVGAASFRVVDIQEIIADADPSFQEGSLQVRYNGPDIMVGGQVQVVDAAKSLIFDEKLSEPATEFSSSRLEGLWAFPSRTTEARLVLSNTTNNALAAGIIVSSVDGRGLLPVTVPLGSHQTRVLDLNQDLIGKQASAVMDKGGISIGHTGLPGALLARLLVEDAATGYSSTEQFVDPKMAKSSKLHGAGLRLEGPGGPLTPFIVARNAGATPTTLVTRVPYSLKDGTTGIAVAPKASLGPGEVKTIDVKSVLMAGLVQKIATAGVEFEYTGEPGSVMVSAQSVSKSSNQVFRVPLQKPMVAGGFPWTIDGTSSTVVYVKNISDQLQRYVMELTYEGGSYMVGMKSLEAGQTAAVDVRALRDNQTADESGKRIPIEASSGQIHWSARGPGQAAMIGRAEQSDPANAMSTSYHCGYCCPDSVALTWLTPGSIIGSPGAQAQFSPTQQDRDCYGNLRSPYTVFFGVVFSSSNPSVATINSFGLGTALALGATQITAIWPTTWFSPNPQAPECFEFPADTECVSDCDVTPPQCAVPVRFRKTMAMDIGGGTLSFKYEWNSSIGSRLNLSACTVGEKVDYNAADLPFPSPPFAAGGVPPDNPTIRNFSADTGAATDDHSTLQPFVKPYVAKTIIATQIYRYTCPCANGGNPVTLLGPHPITRSFTKNANGSWRFRITKTGSSATINPLP